MWFSAKHYQVKKAESLPGGRGGSALRITSSLPRAIDSGVPNTREATCGRSNMSDFNPSGRQSGAYT
jgi:hypothetical protein